MCEFKVPRLRRKYITITIAEQIRKRATKQIRTIMEIEVLHLKFHFTRRKGLYPHSMFQIHNQTSTEIERVHWIGYEPFQRAKTSINRFDRFEGSLWYQYRISWFRRMYPYFRRNGNFGLPEAIFVAVFHHGPNEIVAKIRLCRHNTSPPVDIWLSQKQLYIFCFQNEWQSKFHRDWSCPQNHVMAWSWVHRLLAYIDWFYIMVGEMSRGSSWLWTT